MTTKLNALKLQVPAQRPAPPYAAKMGEIFVAVLMQGQKAARAVATALTASRPQTIRAEMLQSAAEMEADRPAAALTLRSVAAKGWIC